MSFPRTSAELVKNTSTVSPTTLPTVKDALDNLNSGKVDKVNPSTVDAVVRFSDTSGVQKNSSFIVDDSGNLTSFGGQITFPATQSPSASANTLDDYEEGTFTPSMTFGGSSTGVTYANQLGNYTKIGNRTYVDVLFDLTNNGSGVGDAVITGLPFTESGLGSGVAWGNLYNVSATIICPMGYVSFGTSTIALYNFTGGGTVTITDATTTNSTGLRLSTTYKV